MVIYDTKWTLVANGRGCRLPNSKTIVNLSQSLSNAVIIIGLVVGCVNVAIALRGGNWASGFNPAVSLVLVVACVSAARSVLVKLNAIAQEMKSLMEPLPNAAQTSDLDEDTRLATLAKTMMGSNGVAVQNRRYRLNIYANSFIGSEAVTWLIKEQQCSREAAIQLGQTLLEKGMIRHVTDEHGFMDAYLFYRFDPMRIRSEARLDDGQPSQSTQLDIETLVTKLQQPGGIELQNRRYRLSTYPNSLIGSELVDWLVQVQTCSRDEAVDIGQLLIDRRIIHHVTDEHSFEDAYLFYRFYDESFLNNTTSLSPEKLAALDLDAFVQDLHQIDGLIQNRRYRLTNYANCFIGSALVDWVVDRWQYSREEAIALGQLMVEKQIIHHVTDEHPFRDDYLFYRFYADESAP